MDVQGHLGFNVGGMHLLREYPRNLVVRKNDLVDGVFLAFEVGREREVVGVGGEEDLCKQEH